MVNTSYPPDIRAVPIPELAFEPTAHTHYRERVLPMRDGLSKFKDFVPAVGDAGEMLPE